MMIGVRGPPALGLDRADGAGGGQAVHDRHLHVHQDDVEASAAAGRHGLGAVLDGDDLGARRRQDQLDHALVGRVILGQQHPQAAAPAA